MRPASERFANAHLHTIPQPRNLRAFSDLQNAKFDLGVMTGCGCLPDPPAAPSDPLGRILTMSHAKRRRGALAYCGNLRPFPRQVADIATSKQFLMSDETDNC